ncbi:glycoside hydrolase family 3 C-terminal domain-containing protein [Teredinibacter franksiae]|uniref:glycoside hydrolase family 3 C-terminal domain-containing protein n=1 Tax=Teredinibacter franksiae TaxID=2761453 RepID=UPI0016244F08|nr:glycoside hydrolase family 3 C-terminal domain-containing protein [Teredinibacter franksiae]
MTNLFSRLPLALMLVLLCSCSEVEPQAPASAILPYQNTALEVTERVDDLVTRMSLSEKISQLYNDAPAIERLGVPAYDWWNEALHGVARAGKATVFPQAIGLAATFDEQLLNDVATVISDEARAKHHYFVENNQRVRYTGLTFWSPNVNIFRDPRWGRGQETYGEDPYLTGRLAIQFIKGLQGEHPQYLKSAAMAKHYAVHSGPEKSRHSDDYQPTPKDLYETYLPAFEAAVKEAKVESIMCAYNRVNGQPACGSDPLLKDILRGDWGFSGHVVSDCGALADFYGREDHAVIHSPAGAAAWALKSGTDLNCGTQRYSTYHNLDFALQREMVAMADIDNAVKRLFTTRFKLGMFDPAEQVPWSNTPISSVGAASHLQLTQKAAERSLVLLKNDGVLPLQKGTRVAVIGPNATNPSILVGNYHGDPIHPVSPLEGIRQFAGANNVSYAPGSPLIADQYGHYSVVDEKQLFHLNEKNQITPGLKADYYKADRKQARDDFREPFDQLAARVGEPAFSRIDPTIDFFWQRSPVDNQVRGEFGVNWQGLLMPSKSGQYLFKNDKGINILINGEHVDGPINLNADEQYTLQVYRTFLRTEWGNPIEPSIQLRWVNTSENFLANAVTAARKADVIIFTGGISAELEGEEMPVVLNGFDGGDRTHLQLPAEQRNLLQVLRALDKPIVMVNFSGSAMALNWEDQHLNAIVQAFYPGEATGSALANLLWGEFNPSGRLPVTFYKNVNDLPDFKDYSFNNRTYRYFKGDVLYPFGHGLSYTQFEYRNLQLPSTHSSSKALTLSVELHNTGKKAGADVIQLYLSMPDAPVNTPIRSLTRFKRVELDAGGQTSQVFTVSPKQLRYIDNEGISQPYKGKLHISIGSGQPGTVAATQIAQAKIEVN